MSDAVDPRSRTSISRIVRRIIGTFDVSASTPMQCREVLISIMATTFPHPYAAKFVALATYTFLLDVLRAHGMQGYDAAVAKTSSVVSMAVSLRAECLEVVSDPRRIHDAIDADVHRSIARTCGDFLWLHGALCAVSERREGAARVARLIRAMP